MYKQDNRKQVYFHIIGDKQTNSVQIYQTFTPEIQNASPILTVSI